MLHQHGTMADPRAVPLRGFISMGARPCCSKLLLILGQIWMAKAQAFLFLFTLLAAKAPEIKCPKCKHEGFLLLCLAQAQRQMGMNSCSYSWVCVLTRLGLLRALCRQGFRNCIQLMSVLCLSQREPFPYVSQQCIDDAHLLLLHHPLLNWDRERDGC